MPFIGKVKEHLEAGLSSYHIQYETLRIQNREVLLVKIETRENLSVLCSQVYHFNQAQFVDADQILTLGTALKDWEPSEEAKGNSLRAKCLNADVIAHLVGEEFGRIELISAENNIIAVGPNVRISQLVQISEEIYQLVPEASMLKPDSYWIEASAANAFGSGPHPSLSDLTVSLELVRADGAIERMEKKSGDTTFQYLKHCHLGLYGIVIQQQIRCLTAQKMQAVEQLWNRSRLLQEIQKGLLSTAPQRISFSYRSNAGNEYEAEAKPNIRVKTLTPETMIRTAISDINNSSLPTFTNNMVNGNSEEKAITSLAPWSTQVLQTYPVAVDSFGLILRAKLNSELPIRALIYVFSKIDTYKGENGDFPVTLFFKFHRLANRDSRFGLAPSHHEPDEVVFSLEFLLTENREPWKRFQKEVIERLTRDDYGALFDLERSLEHCDNLTELYGERYFLAKLVYEQFHHEREMDQLRNPFLTKALGKLLVFEQHPIYAEQEGAPCRSEDEYESHENSDEEGEEADRNRQRLLISISALPSLSVIVNKPFGLSPIQEALEFSSKQSHTAKSTPNLSARTSPVNSKNNTSPTNTTPPGTQREDKGEAQEESESDDEEFTMPRFHY